MKAAGAARGERPRGRLFAQARLAMDAGPVGAFFGRSRAGAARGGCPRGRLCAQARFVMGAGPGIAFFGHSRRARPAADVREVACLHKLALLWTQARGTRSLGAPGGLFLSILTISVQILSVSPCFCPYGPKQGNLFLRTLGYFSVGNIPSTFESEIHPSNLQKRDYAIH